jgi:hypothetical protein
VLASTDGGESWTERNAGLEEHAVLGLAVSPDCRRDRTLLVATTAGLYRSHDRGASWQPAWSEHDAPGQARVVVSGPPLADGAPPLLGALAGGRLGLSEDLGASWRSLEAPFDAEVVSAAFSPAYGRDRTIFVGTSRPGAAGGGELTLWRSPDGGTHWERWLVTPGADLLPLAVPPSYPLDGLLFTGVGGRVVKPLRQAQEVRAGQRRPIWRGAELAGGALRVTALALSPRYLDDRTLYTATSAGLFVSRNGGERFEPWTDGSGPGATVALAVAQAEGPDLLVYALGLGGTLWRRSSGRSGGSVALRRRPPHALGAASRASHGALPPSSAAQ